MEKIDKSTCTLQSRATQTMEWITCSSALSTAMERTME